MAKQANEMNWVSVQADTLTGEQARLWQALEKAREAFKTRMIADARKAKAIADDETLAFAFKAWGCSIAKVRTKQARKIAQNGNLFANL